MPRIWTPDPNAAADDEPTLDPKAMYSHRDQLYVLAGPHHLLYDDRISDEDLQRMRGAILRQDEGVTKAVVAGLQTVGTPEAQKTAALIADRHEQNKAVETLAGTHEQLAIAYLRTWVARCAANWSRTTQGVTFLRGQYEEALRSANPDPKHIAAWSGVQAALKEQEEKQSKSQKAKDSARKEGAGETHNLLQEVKELRQALANKDQVVAGLQRRLVELEQGALPTPPGPVRGQPR